MTTVMKKVVTMGEIMLRLSTPGHQRVNKLNPLIFIMVAGKRT